MHTLRRRLLSALGSLSIATAALCGSSNSTPAPAALARPAARDFAPVVEAAAKPLAPVQVFVLRHAEKDTDDPRNPSLSEAGQQRAKELERVLRHAGVSHLFASQYRRTRDTLGPLAEAIGREVEVMEAGDARGLAARLRALPAGSVAVVAGHSNTVPGLIGELGAQAGRLQDTPRGPMLGEDEYSRLFLVTLPAPRAEGAVATLRPSCLELAFGAP